ncbi:hypothetical protein BDZ45DRAFT_773323 [Acephala macrosclerotiorum]|nr:hypothetical protein BDZ45DRAFT_773323 [Acephala macrosclerotiorum]
MGSTITREEHLFPSSEDPPIEGQLTLEEVRENDPRYLWYSVETTSPAYHFNSASLGTVNKVCDILSSQYLTKVNASCGLHVHVSFAVSPDHERWMFENLKKLMMFFWIFEPQFDTMHPSSQPRTEFIVRSMRIDSKLSLDLQKEKSLTGSLVREGLDRIYATTTLPELTTLVSTKRRERSMAVSMYYITQFLRPETLLSAKGVKGKIKPTVEFRQYEGTLDGERVWLEERDVDPRSLMDLERECREKERRVRGQSNAADEVGEGHGHGLGKNLSKTKEKGISRPLSSLNLSGFQGKQISTLNTSVSTKDETKRG